MAKNKEGAVPPMGSDQVPEEVLEIVPKAEEGATRTGYNLVDKNQADREKYQKGLIDGLVALGINASEDQLVVLKTKALEVYPIELIWKKISVSTLEAQRSLIGAYGRSLKAREQGMKVDPSMVLNGIEGAINGSGWEWSPTLTKEGEPQIYNGKKVMRYHPTEGDYDRSELEKLVRENF